jgi:hypothetical protein
MKRGGKELDQRFVGSVMGSRRANVDAQDPTVKPNDCRAASTRVNPSL